MKLTITSVEEQKAVGLKGAVKLQFKAQDAEHKELTYFTFSQRLFEFIVEGKIIDATVEVSEREWNGNTYTDRKVTEIEGAPKGSFGGFKGSSFDPVLSRAQTAVNATSMMLAHDVKVPKDIKDFVFEWIRASFTIPTTATTAPSGPSETTPETQEPQQGKVFPLQIGVDFVRESLEKLEKKEEDTIMYLSSKYHVQVMPDLEQMLVQLDELQQDDFRLFLKDKVEGLGDDELPF